MTYIDLLRQGFNEHVALHEKRPGIQKLVVPLFHEDGDMVDIFIEPLSDGRVRVSDKGLSLMRLSYTYELDTPNKERIFRRILVENNISEDRGALFLDVPEGQIYPAVLHFGQTVAKVTNMALYRREVIANLFYEMLQENVNERLGDLKPRENVIPLPHREELGASHRARHRRQSQAALPQHRCASGLCGAEQEGPEHHHQRGRQTVHLAG